VDDSFDLDSEDVGGDDKCSPISPEVQPEPEIKEEDRPAEIRPAQKARVSFNSMDKLNTIYGFKRSLYCRKTFQFFFKNNFITQFLHVPETKSLIKKWGSWH
jgi:hypothetical protein